MNQSQKIALGYLNGDYLINASIIEPIRLNTVDILYASSDCVMVKDKISEVYMLQTENLDVADRLLSDMEQSAVIVAHNTALARFVERKMSFVCGEPCYQAVYRGQPFAEEQSDMVIRLMREDEAEEACSMYRFNLESAIRHIRMGLVYGGYVGEQTAAMIGMHFQGSMGLLEVKPAFRRKGYAEVLEKFLINRLLSQGATPYCQIYTSNEPSLSLQRKLGLDISKNVLYWLHKER